MGKKLWKSQKLTPREKKKPTYTVELTIDNRYFTIKYLTSFCFLFWLLVAALSHKFGQQMKKWLKIKMYRPKNVQFSYVTGVLYYIVAFFYR